MVVVLGDEFLSYIAQFNTKLTMNFMQKKFKLLTLMWNLL